MRERGGPVSPGGQIHRLSKNMFGCFNIRQQKDVYLLLMRLSAHNTSSYCAALVILEGPLV